MRDKFFKWLKRFFIVLPLIVLLINLSIFVLRQNGENLQLQDQNRVYNDDFVGIFIFSGFDGGYDETPTVALNPLINFSSSYIISQDSIMYNVYSGFNNLFVLLVGENSYEISGVYSCLICNFLTWWVFVELVFLFFRFVTFLISWVNSLFDKCFNKINKG